MVLTDDSEIQELNRSFRQKDRPTDVLSFPANEKDDPFPSTSLGDVVISVDTARRQANEYGVLFEEEITRLLLHGILHLLGYDHEGVPPVEAQAMRRLEKATLEKIVSGR